MKKYPYETNFSGIKYLPTNTAYCFLWNKQVISVNNQLLWTNKKELHKELLKNYKG
jgi:hypothetical protein